jgi:hypothetical protein
MANEYDKDCPICGCTWNFFDSKSMSVKSVTEVSTSHMILGLKTGACPKCIAITYESDPLWLRFLRFLMGYSNPSFPIKRSEVKELQNWSRKNREEEKRILNQKINY